MSQKLVILPTVERPSTSVVLNWRAAQQQEFYTNSTWGNQVKVRYSQLLTNRPMQQSCMILYGHVVSCSAAAAAPAQQSPGRVVAASRRARLPQRDHPDSAC